MSTLLIQADATSLPLADASVHCVVTSPPYWGLRDYGVAGQLGLEKSMDCLGWATGNPCGVCYICRMREVFREVRRVLRDDGTLWLNMGDVYAHGKPGGGSVFDNGRNDGRVSYDADKARGREKIGTLSAGLKPKDLCGVPWRLALALQADGWYLRMDCIWHKPNPMPESVRDRPTKAHEYVFMMSKSERYFFDAEAVREKPSGISGGLVFGGKHKGIVKRAQGFRNVGREFSQTDRDRYMTAGANLRSVWRIPTQAYKGAHFATFPMELARRCIKAGTFEKGVCPKCGAPWRRIVDRVATGETQKMADGWDTGSGGHGTIHRDGREAGRGGVPVTRTVTTAWLPSCECPPADPIPAIVLDPFAGAGTVAVVARELNRSSIGIELNPEYIELARARLAATPSRRSAKRRPLRGQLDLFAEVA